MAKRVEKPSRRASALGPPIAIGEGIAAEAAATQGVVLSGGGAKGSFEVGVMKALVDGRAPSTGGLPITPSIFTGTSVGGYNATFLAAFGPGRLAAAVDDLWQGWRCRIADTPTSCGNGVYRIRAAPFQFLDPGCLLHPVSNFFDLGRDALSLGRSFTTHAAAFALSQQDLRQRLLETVDIAAFFDTEPFDEMVDQTIDLRALAASPMRLSIVASEWKTGVAHVFDKHDIARRYGHAPVRATASIPTLFPPVDIEGTLFVDGGVTMNTPLQPAIEDGADVIHVVFVDPFIQDIPFPPVPNTIDEIYRLYVILIADNINGDVLATAIYNEELRLLRSLELRRQQLDLAVTRLRGLAEKRYLSPLAVLLDRLARGEAVRPIEVHKYRPKTDLGGAPGLLDFGLGAIEESFADGYRAAAEHDCTQEGCVLVQPEEWRQALREVAA